MYMKSLPLWEGRILVGMENKTQEYQVFCFGWVELQKKIGYNIKREKSL
jgi:hypothetical protein